MNYKTTLLGATLSLAALAACGGGNQQETVEQVAEQSTPAPSVGSEENVDAEQVQYALFSSYITLNDTPYHVEGQFLQRDGAIVSSEAMGVGLSEQGIGHFYGFDQEEPIGELDHLFLAYGESGLDNVCTLDTSEIPEEILPVIELFGITITECTPEEIMTGTEVYLNALEKVKEQAIMFNELRDEGADKQY